MALALPLNVLAAYKHGLPAGRQHGTPGAAAARDRATRRAARQGLEQHCEFHEPVNGFQEQVFYHYLEAGEDGRVRVGLNNPAFDGGRGLSLYVRYPLQEYPVLVEWKMMGDGMYVVGIEPANCHVGGRCQERERGTLQMLAPQETRTFHLEVGFATGKS